MTVLFMVTNGDYSDYHVLGIYDSLEFAKQAKEIFNAKNDIQEMVLNSIPEIPNGLLPWAVHMLKTGEVVKACRMDFPREDWDQGDESLWPASTTVENGMAADVWAKDQKHAIKIVNEKRIQALALGQWQENWKAWQYEKFHKPAIERALKEAGQKLSWYEQTEK